MRWTFRNIVLAAGGLLLLYLVGMMSLYIFINPIVFRAERTGHYKTPVSQRIREERIPLPGDQQLYAYFFAARAPHKGVVLFLHGVRGNLDRYAAQCLQFTQRGYSVLMPDGRGFGRSEGRIGESSLMEDVLACSDWLSKRFREDSLVVYAMDFMVPAACYANSIWPCRLLVLDNPVYSLRSWIRCRYPAFVLPYELKYDFNTYEYLPNCLSPVFILRPQHRAACTPEEATRLQQMLPDPGAFLQLEEAPGESPYEQEPYRRMLDQLLMTDSR
ncbi:MAG: alpha/beta hydrolase [Saprospiraceae bacterium]|nr:alpha/beta hydrolase [Saprospiraceae bacterium]